MEGSNGSLTDRAASGEGSEPEQELFPLGSVEGDKGVSVKTLIRAGLPVQLTVSMSSAEVPIRGDGLLHPENEGGLLVRFEAGKVEEVPVREGEAGQRKLTGWKVRQTLRPVYVERIAGEADNVEAEFALLLDGNPRAAEELLGRLQARMGEVLQAA